MEPAVIGIVGVIDGILFSNVATIVLDLRRRHERIRDVQTALRAEMRTHWHRLDPVNLERQAELIVSRIVLHYAHAKSIAHFVDDLRSDALARLEPSRKIQIYRDYIAMKVQAHGLVSAAITAVDGALAANRVQ